jgi:NitT/TauT family transport system substrate-binding protein
MIGRRDMMRIVRVCSNLLVAICASLAMVSPVSAQSTVRIADQYSLVYLPLLVAVEHHLIEKHAAALGQPDVRVETMHLGSGAATNDALISGSVDVAIAAMPVIMNLWDKTVGHNTVKAMMAIADSPMYFNTIDPRIKSVRDFTPNDRIAMTSGRGTSQAIVLEMAAAKAFGWDERNRLNTLAVSMAHPDAATALISGGGMFKTHITVVPFIQWELAQPGVRTILSSYDLTGGRHTFVAAYTTERWRNENPKLYSATVEALTEAMDLIKKDKKAAAELYVRVERSKLGVDEILKILNDENMMSYTPTPTKVGVFADFMMRSGLLQHKVSSWKDLFFDNVHNLPGN